MPRLVGRADHVRLTLPLSRDYSHLDTRCLTGHLTQRRYTLYGFDAFPLRCRMRQAGLAWHFVTFTLGVARRRAGEPAPFFRKCLQLHQKLAGHLVLAYVVSSASAPRGMGSSPPQVSHRQPPGTCMRLRRIDNCGVPLREDPFRAWRLEQATLVLPLLRAAVGPWSRWCSSACRSRASRCSSASCRALKPLAVVRVRPNCYAVCACARKVHS